MLVLQTLPPGVYFACAQPFMLAGDNSEVPWRQMCEGVVAELNQLDRIARVRFALARRRLYSVCGSWEEVDRLEKQLSHETRRQQLELLAGGQ